MDENTPIDPFAAIGATLDDVEATAPYESDPRRPSVKLSHALRDALVIVGDQRAQLAALVAEITDLRAHLAVQDATIAAHADKLAAHDAYEARIAALEAAAAAAAPAADPAPAV